MIIPACLRCESGVTFGKSVAPFIFYSLVENLRNVVASVSPIYTIVNREFLKLCFACQEPGDNTRLNNFEILRIGGLFVKRPHP